MVKKINPSIKKHNGYNQIYKIEFFDTTNGIILVNLPRSSNVKVV